MGHVLHCHQGDVSPTPGVQTLAQLAADDQVEAVQQNLPHFRHQSSENKFVLKFSNTHFSLRQELRKCKQQMFVRLSGSSLSRVLNFLSQLSKHIL